MLSATGAPELALRGFRSVLGARIPAIRDALNISTVGATWRSTMPWSRPGFLVAFAKGGDLLGGLGFALGASRSRTVVGAMSSSVLAASLGAA